MKKFNPMKIIIIVGAALWAVCPEVESNALRRVLRSSEDIVGRARDVSGPSIPATPKPPCPSYITCPYPSYPRPTTKPPATNEEASSQPTSQSPTTKVEITTQLSSSSSGGIVDRFDSSPDTTSKNPPVQMGASTNIPTGPGNANGPSISATSKPPCPSYITCPYPPYPRPTTKSPTTSETTHSTTVNPDKELSDRFGAGTKPTEKPSHLVQTDSEGNKPIAPGNANGPSISATQKPPCPSYITCPYPPYPRPTTKPPSPSDSAQSTTDRPNQELGNRVGLDNPSENVSSSTEINSEATKPVGLGNANGPSISATKEPPCPSYITCPYPPYPRPTTKPPSNEVVSQSTTPSSNKNIVDRIDSENGNPIDDLTKEQDSSPQSQDLQSVIRPESSVKPHNEGEATTVSSDDNERNDGNSIVTTPLADEEIKPTESGVSIPYPVTTDPPPSIQPISPDDWNFPGPSEKIPSSTSFSSENGSDAPVVDLVEYASDTYYSNKGPSISATQKPECPFYASCPYEYPKPTTASPYVNQVHVQTQTHAQTQAQANVLNRFGAQTNRIKPPILSKNPQNLVPYFGGNDEVPFEQSTVDPIALGNQGAFLPIYSYVYGFDQYGQGPYYNSYYNRRPSILLTPRPFWPSYLKNPWIYPRPFGSYLNDQDSSAESAEEDGLNDSVEEERGQFETDPNIYN